MGDTGRVNRTLACLLGLALLTACNSGAGAKPETKPISYHGVETQPAPKRPTFVLTDTSGKRFDFGAETSGRPTFVYFGYTNCPDLCPTAMADVASALRKVPSSLAGKVRVVFVTTDPRRDTAPVLRRWLDQFSTGFIGLRGTQAEVDAAQKATGITPAHPEGPVPTIAGHPDRHLTEKGTAPHKHFGPLGYAVAHTAAIFAYNAADRLPVVYPGGVTPSDIAADLPALAAP